MTQNNLQFCPLEQITRPTVTTEEAAHFLNRKLCAYSTQLGHSVQSKLDSLSVATRGLFFTPDLIVSSN